MNTPRTDAIVEAIAASGWQNPLSTMHMLASCLETELQHKTAEQAKTEQLYKLLSEKHESLLKAHRALIDRLK